MNGHIKWFDRVVEIAKHVFTQTPIKILTVWGLSTENLIKRSGKELDYLFKIFQNIPNGLKQLFSEEKIKFKVAWDISKLPENLQKILKKKIKETSSFETDRYFIICLNYWWQDEILRWIKKVLKNKSQNIEDITVSEFSKYLDFSDLPTIDLVIRTKWDVSRRLSGFMTWWIWYAQLYFTPLTFPDFNTKQFDKAIKWYDEVYNYQNHWK